MSARTRSLASALTLGALCVGAALAFQTPAPPDLDGLYGFAKPGHDDDPSARLAWEEARYADPATGRVPEDIRSRELAFASTLPVSSSRLSEWSLRGPLGLGGRTRALALDVTDDDVVLAGGVSGGMWRSTDGALTWTKTTGPLQLQSVTALVQDTRPGRTDRWYYGTGEFRANSASDPGATYRGDGIYTSADGGQSWLPLAGTVSGTPGSSSGDPFDYVWNLALDATNADQDEVYAATWLGIYRSVDGGDTWTAVLPMSSGASDVAVAADGTVYAALEQSDAYWTSPDGETWTSITPDDLPGGQNRTVIATAPSDPAVVYFVGDHGAGYANPRTVFFRYDAVAGTMENRSDNAQSATGGIQNYIQYCLGAAVHPLDPDVVYLAGVNLYRTDDAFASATVRTLGNGHADNHAFAFTSDAAELFVGSDGGVHRTTSPLSNGPFWADRNAGYTTSQFYDLALDPLPGGERLVGGLQDNGSWLARSADPADWRKLQGGDGAFSAFTADPAQVIVSYQNGEMRRRTYNAAGGETASVNIRPPTSGFQFIHPLDIDPVGLRKFYTFTGNDVWINPDISALGAQNTWAEIPNAVGGTISTVTAAHVPTDRLWVGTSGGSVYRIDDVFADGRTTRKLDPPEFPNGNVVQFATHPTDPDEVVVAFSNYNVDSVWRTTDGGDTWTSISGNLEENADGSGAGPSVRSVGILPTPGGAIYYAATSAGIYSAAGTDGGATVWELEAPDLIGYLVVDDVEVRHQDNVVAVATHGGGMFSTQALPVSAGAAPRVRDLAVVSYPNPSAGRAQVSVQTESAARLRVDVYDALGRRVATLHDGPVAAGGGVTVPLGGEALAPGRYVVRARAGDRVETTAVTIVR